MSNHIHYIHTLCQRIYAQGKRPTTALIRKHADRPLSLPQIVAALKTWQNEPNDSLSIESRQPAPEQAPKSLRQRVEELEAEVACLRQQLAQLLEDKSHL